VTEQTRADARPADQQDRTDARPADQQTADQQSADQQDREVGDCFFELLGNIVNQAEQLAQRLGIPAPFIKALHTLDCPMAMKDLGKRMHCDPSFVTLLTDMLEKRGLARREPHLADRRIKNIVLTDDGLALKQKVEDEITARMPWNRALTEAERGQLLFLIRKMLSVSDDSPDATGASGREDEHGQLANLIAGALHEQLSEASHASPPASTGEVRSP
jgi:MarR family transcriptional regulator, organic hydroperoxide resistance regulator